MLSKLRDVSCDRCRRAGHRCQAQIEVDGIPLCLRCRDDEPCIYVTATGAAGAVDSDPCIIPRPSREDRQAIAELPRLPSIHAPRKKELKSFS